MNPKLIDKLNEQLASHDSFHVPDEVKTWWRVFQFDEKTGIITRLVEQKNIIPYQGADVLAQLLAGNADYKAAAMFFEFQNAADPNTIAIPSPARSEGIDYYLNDVPLTPNRDYLRVPLVVPAGVTSSDSGKYAGNQATFFAITSGTQGVHGTAFSAAADSHVFGVALAATPEPTEYTRDWLFSRSYAGFSPVPKEDGYQIGAQYLIRFR